MCDDTGKNITYINKFVIKVSKRKAPNNSTSLNSSFGDFYTPSRFHRVYHSRASDARVDSFQSILQLASSTSNSTSVSFCHDVSNLQIACKSEEPNLPVILRVNYSSSVVSNWSLCFVKSSYSCILLSFVRCLTPFHPKPTFTSAATFTIKQFYDRIRASNPIPSKGELTPLELLIIQSTTTGRSQ